MNHAQASRLPIADRRSWLWLAIAAVLFVFANGMYRLPLAGLLAPLFLIRFLRTRKVGAGYVLMMLALMAANIVAWWDLMPNFTTPVRIIFGLMTGLLYTVPFLLDRVLVSRLSGFAATLVFPFANAAFEFLTMWPSPMGTYGAQAYSQFSSIHLTQVASITGMWGVTFLVSWFASTANWIWEEGVDWPRIRRGVAIFAGVMLLVLGYGAIRLTYFFPEPGSVRIHSIVETDYTVHEWDTELWTLAESDPQAFRARMAPVYERYLEATVREAQAGAQIVIWPELAVEGIKEDVEAVVVRAQDIARQEGIYLSIGIGSIDASNAEGGENRLVLIGPSGEILIDYLKYGCTAFNMYSVEVPTVETPYGTLGAVICCDLDFPYVIRQASQKGVDILLDPSFEPTEGNITAHSRMASFRAIENGMSIFRPTSQGISLAIDPYGRTLASMDATRVSERVFVVQVPNHRVTTVYSVVGELFGWLAVAGFLFIAGWAIVRGRKANAAS
jgi:apolipoprotein N-acyltransferase